MKQRLLHLIQIILDPSHLKRTGWIALIVGSWLTAVNQGDLILRGNWSLILGGKVVLNYLTPFVVANLGLLARKVSVEEMPSHQKRHD